MSDDDKREIMYTLGLLQAEQRNMRDDIADIKGIITKIEEQDKKRMTGFVVLLVGALGGAALYIWQLTVGQKT